MRAFAEGFVKLTDPKEVQDVLTRIAGEQESVKTVLQSSRLKEATQRATQPPLHKNGKVQFRTTEPIEPITPSQRPFLANVNLAKAGTQYPLPVAKVPKEVGGIEKSLVLDKAIVDKVIKDHGAFPSDNFIATTNNPSQIVIFDNGERINFVKQFGENNYFVAGATKNNGYYSVTFFEPERAGYVKNKILTRGKVIDFPGGAFSSFATSPKGAASQLASPQKRFPGVSQSTDPIIPQASKLKETRLTLPQKQAALEAKGAEELAIRQASADLAQSERALFTDTQIADINRLKTAARSKAGQAGDIETLRKAHPQLTERVIEAVREVKKVELADTEALDIALSLPVRTATIAGTPTEIVQARGLNKQVKAFMQGVREGKKYSKDEVAKYQKDLTSLLRELPISERGKLTFLTGLRQANTAEKVSREAEKIETAMQKVDEARVLAKALGRKRSNIAFIKKIAEFNETVIRDSKKQLNLQKPIRKMEDEELNAMVSELSKRLRFKEARGFKAKDPRLPVKEEEKVFTEAMYQANREKIAQGDGGVRKLYDTIKTAVTTPNETLDNLLGSISTRLKNIDPSLKKALREFEYKTGIAKQNDTKAVEPFLKKIRAKNIDKRDYVDLDLALKNGDGVKIQSIVSKYELEEEFANIRTTLNDLYKRAQDVGYDIGYKKNYFPRMIADEAGFLDYVQKGDDWSLIDKAIRTKEHELARYLAVDEKVHLINTLIRGYKSSQISLSKTGAMKARTVDKVDAGLNQFYRDSIDALVRYIDLTNDAIEARKFFGRGIKIEQAATIENSIGKYTLDLITQGKIKPSQERLLRDILLARFNPSGTHGLVNTYQDFRLHA